MNSNFDNQFQEALTNATKELRNLMELTSEYHGKHVTTEYLLTTFIALEFMRLSLQTEIEYLNRNLVNGLTCKKGSTSKNLGSKRTDIVILKDSFAPLAIIEVKIGVSTLSKIRVDLNKITDTVSRLNDKTAADLIGAVVFQMHVTGSKGKKLYSENDFRSAIEKKENSLKKELQSYALHKTDFTFDMMPLQGVNDGIAPQEIIDGEYGKEQGKYGHVIRYYMIKISRTVTKPSPPKVFKELRKQ